jgi:hypothetical protein
MLETFQSSCSAERLGAARAFIERFPAATETLTVSASRDAADDDGLLLALEPIPALVDRRRR